MGAPRLVLLPGSLCSPALWTHVVRELSPAVAASAVLPPHSSEHTTEAAAQALLSSLPPGPLALCGFSVGGYIALEMLRQAPAGRVAGLGIVGSQCREDAPAVKKLRADLVRLARAEGVAAVLGRQRGILAHAAHPRAGEVWKEIQRMADEVGPDGFEAQQQQASSRSNRCELLQQLPLNVPLLVAVGRNDAITPVQVSETIFRRVPSAPGAFRRLAVLGGSEPCGHMAPLEQPSELAREVETW
eukprot:Hpha_TRINITY_DN22502_c0_g1::TRINITY_DN22502_c0_g1_i1::g.185143::m.185143